MGSPFFSIGWMSVRQENCGHAPYLSTHLKHVANMQSSTASIVLWRISVGTSGFVHMLVEDGAERQAGTFWRQVRDFIVKPTDSLSFLSRLKFHSTENRGAHWRGPTFRTCKFW